jgi:phosphomannomutase
VTEFREVDGDFPNHHPGPGEQARNLVDLINALKTGETPSVNYV